MGDPEDDIVRFLQGFSRAEEALSSTTPIRFAEGHIAGDNLRRLFASSIPAKCSGSKVVIWGYRERRYIKIGVIMTQRTSSKGEAISPKYLCSVDDIAIKI